LRQASSGGAISLEQVESVVMAGSVLDSNTASFGGAAVVVGSADKLCSFQVTNTSINRHQVRLLPIQRHVLTDWCLHITNSINYALL
jgi:hypothetical protein